MTQSTLRFLIGATLTVGLVASLARGDDKNKPELLPPPHCEACDKASSCCSPGAPCCQENAPCCQNSTIFFVPRVQWSEADFLRPWSTENQTNVACPVMCCGAQANSAGVSILQVQVCCESKASAPVCANQATTKKPTESIMVRRVFPVLDLVSPVVLRVVEFGPNGQNGQHQNDCFADELIKLIQNTIEPESWSAAGGPGTIEFFPLGKAIVLNQSPDVVEQVQELLNALRRLQVQKEVSPYTYTDTRPCPMTMATSTSMPPGVPVTSTGLRVSCDSACPTATCPTLVLAQVAPTLAKVESSPATAAQYSKMEREILRKLDYEIVSFNYAGIDFTKAIRDLATQAGVNIVLDCPALVAAGLEDDPAGMSVPMRLEGARLRAVLNLFLHQGHMTFKVENDAIVVVPDLVLLNSLRCSKNQAEVTRNDVPATPGCFVSPVKAVAKVGQIVISGNCVTPDEVIRRRVGLYPGQTLDSADLKVAERNLATPNGAKASVCVINPDGAGEFKDILVTVEEQPGGESKPAGCSNSNPSGAAKQAPNCPSVILVQPGNIDLGEVACWAFGAFAEWVCEGTTEKCPTVPTPAPTFVTPSSTYTPATPPIPCPQPRVVTSVGPDGLIHMGIDFESCTRFPSPLPPPVPTFHIPPAVAASMTTPQPLPIAPVSPVTSPGTMQDCLSPMPRPGEAIYLSGTRVGVVVPCTPTEFATLTCPVPGRPTMTPATTQQASSCPNSIPSTPQFAPFGSLNQAMPTSNETAIMPSYYTRTTFVPPAATQHASSCPGSIPSIPQFAPFGFLNQFTPTSTETAAMPSCCMQTAFVPPVSNVPEKRGGDHWVMRMNPEGGRQTFTVQSASTSIECERLSLHWRESISLEFVRGTQGICVHGKNFEAEAESIDWQEHEGKLVLCGKASLKSGDKGRPTGVLNAKKIIWDCASGNFEAEGVSVLTSR